MLNRRNTVYTGGNNTSQASQSVHSLFIDNVILNVTGFGKTLRMGSCARFAQCAFLVAQVQICQSPDFVIYMSNNPSNYCRLLQRLVVLYEGEISLHLDPPSRHSHHTQSPLLWAVIRILYLDTARFINLLYVRSPF